MTKSTFFGSALALLLALSVISYSKTFIQQQAPKSAKIQQPTVFEVVGQTPEVAGPTLPTEGADGPSPADLAGKSTASNAGLPATTAPIGLTRDGLPVGVQIVGPYLEDATPIDVAGRLAEVIGGFTPPKGF